MLEVRMSYDARVFNVMIASPSDVQVERTFIRQAIDEWNEIHAEREGCVLLPIDWHTHSTPTIGDRPQAIINQQVLKNADLLIAVFWTRLGSPTGTSPSGTIEEIEEHIGAGKPAMIYFSSVPVRPDSVDDKQYSALKAFREAFKQRGLVEEYETLDEFGNKVRRQLQQTALRNLCGEKQVAPSTATADFVTGNAPRLPDDAIRLLLEAARDQHGSVLTTTTFGGTQVQTNGIEFVEIGDARSEAHWREMLGQLAANGLLSGSGDGVARLTAAGYRAADSLASQPSPDAIRAKLSEWWRQPGAPRFRLHLAGTRGNVPWTFEATVEQFAGTDVGDLAGAWRGPAVVGTNGRFQQTGARKWRLPSAQVDPARETGGEAAIELHLEFFWDGDRRQYTQRWAQASDFQSVEASEAWL